jgi:hypothetical protein
MSKGCKLNSLEVSLLPSSSIGAGCRLKPPSFADSHTNITSSEAAWNSRVAQVMGLGVGFHSPQFAGAGSSIRRFVDQERSTALLKAVKACFALMKTGKDNALRPGACSNNSVAIYEMCVQPRQSREGPRLCDKSAPHGMSRILLLITHKLPPS